MPDTTSIYHIQTDSLLQNKIDRSLEDYYIHPQNIISREEAYFNDHVAVLVILIILLLSITFLYLLATNEKFNTWIIWVSSTPDSRNNSVYNNHYTPPFNGYVYNKKNLGLTHNDIVATLSKYFPYYKNLNMVLQYRFINRLKEFMNDKTFIIQSKQPYKEMPVLLSASAVQLTFGLDRYLLPNYQFIQIYETEYFAQDNSLRVLAGHVVGNTITVAWNHYLKGYTIHDDGVNLGLHEMAHAVYYQHLIADRFKLKHFKRQFSEILEEGSEILEKKYVDKELFSTNAYKNLQELWAESVELFFEKPHLFKEQYPDLFEDIQLLLNQNPFNPSIPVAL